ncbi:tetratricopeptide repeat protein [Flavobacterium paronense]|uniref:Tetratricopeptide repeat protein n=1 Tax=Flavobacterium paronense TaxID=1392775 RepID=A0ABV5GDR8_9FLAO|nr:tetratricopeptide repeat protein [Flavobacterium paronense]MDN3678087.1 tetratricopeptide repeat protein [Flavobacterium paronense]
MKAIIFIFGILFITNSNAQKFDCASKIIEYQELFKAKKITESFDAWSDVRKNCPKENEAIYTNGLQILQYKIDNAASPEEKEKLVRDVLKLYDQYNKNFPLNTPDFEVNKAMVLIANKIDSKDEIFNLLDSGFAKASQNIIDANAIFTYFSMYCEKFNSGDKKITANAVLEKYSLVNSLLNQLQTSKPENRDYKTAQNAIDNLIKDLATCENLDAFYSKNYPDNQENTDWITSALMSLSGKCSNKPIFMTLAEKLYALKVTAQSANFLALGNLKQRKFTEAIKFYNESAELQTNSLEKAKIYYTLATGLLANDLPKSKEYLNKALTSDSKMGKAYLFLAQLYSNSANDCGKTDFEKKAVYYLAIQTAQKAGIAEPRLKPTADKMAKDFEAKSVTTAEISKAKMNGISLTIGCWINETITFPAK